MVRVGGLGFRLKPNGARGKRIDALVRWPSGESLDDRKAYLVAGWASVNEGVEGPAVYDLVSSYVRAQGTVRIEPNRAVQLVA